MNKTFKDYMTAIEMETPLVQRVNTLINLAENIFDLSVSDIFVTNYPTEEGRVVYENLWMISGDYILEAKKFISETDIDRVRLGKMHYIRIVAKNYDFKKAEDSSIFTVSANREKCQYNFKAYKNNCDYLYEYFNKYIKNET